MVAMKPREQEMDARRPSHPYPAYRPSGILWLRGVLGSGVEGPG